MCIKHALRFARLVTDQRMVHDSPKTKYADAHMPSALATDKSWLMWSIRWQCTCAFDCTLTYEMSLRLGVLYGTYDWESSGLVLQDLVDHLTPYGLCNEVHITRRVRRRLLSANLSHGVKNGRKEDAWFRKKPSGVELRLRGNNPVVEWVLLASGILRDPVWYSGSVSHIWVSISVVIAQQLLTAQESPSCSYIGLLASIDGQQTVDVKLSFGTIAGRSSVNISLHPFSAATWKDRDEIPLAYLVAYQADLHEGRVVGMLRTLSWDSAFAVATRFPDYNRTPLSASWELRNTLAIHGSFIEKFQIMWRSLLPTSFSSTFGTHGSDIKGLANCCTRTVIATLGAASNSITFLPVFHPIGPSHERKGVKPHRISFLSVKPCIKCRTSGQHNSLVPYVTNKIVSSITSPSFSPLEITSLSPSLLSMGCWPSRNTSKNAVGSRALSMALTSVPGYQCMLWNSQYARANDPVSTPSIIYAGKDGWSSIPPEKSLVATPYPSMTGQVITQKRHYGGRLFKTPSCHQFKGRILLVIWARELPNTFGIDNKFRLVYRSMLSTSKRMG
ncbi:hypothetical protein EDD17DRAFT_1898787 [Pisolithus thermaeus]|nr:hypothetical protein EDD17DRAFT_1898787 [Pisolithus thermaeus]